MDMHEHLCLVDETQEENRANRTLANYLVANDQ
jgi:hypothetical protein